MKPIRSTSKLPGDPFLPNRFIFGDAVDNDAIEEYEYLLHTEHPAFVCRIIEQELDFRGSGGEGFKSAMLFNEEENVSYYACNEGITFTDFNFFGEAEPAAGVIRKICDDAVQAYWAIDAAYKKKENQPLRGLRVLKREAADNDDTVSRASRLADAARAAASDPVAGMQLAVQTQTALIGNEPRVLTEAQLALLGEPAARELLLARARELISHPDVARPDGSFKPYELWGIPLMYTVNHAGDCWYFPKLSELENVLREAFGLPGKAALHVSPVLFSHDMLREANCQTLVHVAAALDAGEAFVPEDVEAMKKRYDEERQRFMPRLTLGWIVVAVERGTLGAEALQDPNALLDAAMPAIEQAMNVEIDYGEATIYQPEPVWESLATGTAEYNQKRMTFTAALLEKNVGLSEVQAEIEYRPQQSAYWLTIKNKHDGEALTSFAWLIAPDLAPDRDGALEMLTQTLKDIGIAIASMRDTLH